MADLLNSSALEPLFAPWEEPDSHRVRVDKERESAKIIKGRRPSSIVIAQNIRGAVREWREGFYSGASDTTRHLLDHWFNRSHQRTTPAGEDFEFRYYFCQREAIETLIYLKEVRKLDCLSQIVAEFGGEDRELAALGITEEEDAWSRYAFKLATGAGKTKVMSLAIVWSYFHALRESESEMAKHFVVIAPGLTVYERLKDDFRPGDEHPDIFHNDPLIPLEWLGDWNLSVVLQDEATGATSGGVLYLTNIHRLHDPGKRSSKGQSETYEWIGPPVSKAAVFDTAAALRERIIKHPRVMVINDEAHHVWDPDSAWNEALCFIHDGNRQHGGAGLVAQLDFSATPRDNKGQVFKHVVCDTPLGEAVDGGIVKTPVVGRADEKLEEQPGDNAAYIFERHLVLGYERWKRTYDEWKKSNKKALLFVMCNSTPEADQITYRLNSDELFKDLNGSTINLHTNLKGKLKKEGRGSGVRYVFEESEKEISDEDLKALRKLSRELDSNTSPYNCIVSVLMLREGWDVRNVTTVVPLRPFTARAKILPEQTLGRGLRRMTPPGQAAEILTVVEHPAFASLYAQELAQEGLPIEITDIDRIPATTVSIYPDESKDLKGLEIQVPRLSGGYRIQATLEGLKIEDVHNEFHKYKPLPLGGQGKTEVQYEGRHLFTNEVVERLKINLPLLQSGVGAVSYLVKQLEHICKLRGMHAVLAPLVQTFLEEILFEKKTDLYDQALIARLADSDVSEHVRAVFVPLIRARTTIVEKRMLEASPMTLSRWKPFQVTHSERHPVVKANHTLFNLVPCNRELEVAVANFVDRASDVAAFAKNSGPQCLRIDYLASGSRLSFYTPDFFVRSKQGHYYLIETKGREDKDVPRKVKAAIAWCESASKSGGRWEYIYLPQGVFERLTGDTVAELARTCKPALKTLLESDDTFPQMPLFAAAEAAEQEKAPELKGIVDEATLQALPPRYRKAVEQATILFRFFENKEGMNYSPVFNALLGSLDEAARGLVLRRLQPLMPATVPDQKTWFDPSLRDADRRMQPHYEKMAQNLKRTLVFKNGFMPLGLLRDCMEYALNDNTKIEGIFQAVKLKFQVAGGRDLFSTVTAIYDFRNTRVAHQEKEITDAKEAERNLIGWIKGLEALTEAIA
jgi:type III restriction enzyme